MVNDIRYTFDTLNKAYDELQRLLKEDKFEYRDWMELGFLLDANGGKERARRIWREAARIQDTRKAQ